MSAGSDTDSNISEGIYDGWMAGDSQQYHYENLQVFTDRRKDSLGARKNHEDVEKITFEHRNLYVHRPSPLAIDERVTPTDSSKYSTKNSEYIRQATSNIKSQGGLASPVPLDIADFPKGF